MRLDVSVIFYTVLLYLCTVEEFFFTVLGYCSATVVMDNHSLFYVYIDTVSPAAKVQIYYRLSYTHAQLIPSFPWTPARRAAYNHP